MAKNYGRTLWRYKGLLAILFAAITLILIQTSFLANSHTAQEKTSEDIIRSHLEQRVQIAKTLSPFIDKLQRPNELTFSWNGNDPQAYSLQYTIDEELQNESDKLLHQYKPDYGAIFMMDAETGKVLVYSSFEKESESPESLVKRSTFPAASVFKIVTATAAIDRAGLHPSHKIQFNGGNWTLYKKNVMLDKITKWTRTVSLREAFAKSMNTPFGKLSLTHLSPDDLVEYSNRFMFNQSIPADFPVDPGTAHIPSEKTFELTEAASGFNKLNRMSPVQGAMIAASIINNGKMVVPYIVDSIKDKEGHLVYRGSPLERGNIMASDSAEKIKDLMSETIYSGTSRRTFYKLLRNKKYKQVEMGGKTGHLTGDNPKGQVDWFVGFASDGERQIAIAALTVNKKYWTVKSSHLGQTLFKKYFDPQFEVATDKTSPQRHPTNL